MDLISIVIPYYKKSEFIETTIQSILKQTYKNFEIIIVYDDNDKKDLESAIEEAYELVNQIEFEGKFFRTDIGKKGLSYKRGKSL